MKERPILMQADMVKAILDNRKSMTRRLQGLKEINKNPGEWVQPYQLEVDPTLWTWRSTKTGEVITIKCPYGQVGDGLWVRETFYEPNVGGIIYKASELPSHYNDDGSPSYPYRSWQPSIHMPRWASRIDRIIALLRAERLLDISEADAKAEGFSSREEFLTYWDILNKKRGYGTEANPWNWVIGW